MVAENDRTESKRARMFAVSSSTVAERSGRVSCLPWRVTNLRRTRHEESESESNETATATRQDGAIPITLLKHYRNAGHAIRHTDLQDDRDRSGGYTRRKLYIHLQYTRGQARRSARIRHPGIQAAHLY